MRKDFHFLRVAGKARLEMAPCGQALLFTDCSAYPLVKVDLCHPIWMGFLSLLCPVNPWRPVSTSGSSQRGSVGIKNREPECKSCLSRSAV